MTSQVNEMRLSVYAGTVLKDQRIYFLARMLEEKNVPSSDKVQTQMTEWEIAGHRDLIVK